MAALHSAAHIRHGEGGGAALLTRAAPVPGGSATCLLHTGGHRHALGAPLCVYRTHLLLTGDSTTRLRIGDWGQIDLKKYCVLLQIIFMGPGRAWDTNARGALSP